MSKNAKKIKQQTPPRLLRLDNVIELIGLSRGSIYRLMSKERFPKPLRLSTRSVAWHIDDLNAWIDSLPKGGE